MKAIIYISNTGSTAEYAKLLGKELNLPVHSLQQAKTNVPAGSETQPMREIWFYVMSGGVMIKVAVMEIARIIQVI